MSTFPLTPPTTKGTSRACEEHCGDEGCEGPTPGAPQKRPLTAAELRRFISSEAMDEDDDDADEDGAPEEESSSSSSDVSQDSEQAKPTPVLRRTKSVRRFGRLVFSDGEEEELNSVTRVKPNNFLIKPDVGAYLDSFDLPHTDQIALCRTWANYLGAKNRPLSYKKAKKE